ncbi:MAG: Phenazine antibiotic resistance protein EhpR [Pseudomonas citronellolis]|nr:MAG: Phenazine antibiotic resistance protein EhpR [Pseudomonas citronellolis]
MLDPNFTLLYVADVPRSARFYAELLGLRQVEASPTFSLFVSDSGARLGLWNHHGVEPAVQARPGATEVILQVAERAEVEVLHQRWLQQGVSILQAPVAMDFGYTFCAQDPDGHRLRVYFRTL